jgi:glucose-6-phosphate 1-dehydrogenase
MGDRSLFTTEAGLRAAFEAFAPLQGPDRPTPQPYAPGSWGPEAAAELAKPYRWMLGQ